MKTNKKLYVLKEMSVSKALIYLSIPSILTSLVNTLHNLIDMAVITAALNRMLL